MTKQINTGVAELLLVKVPDDAHDIDYRNGVKLLSWLTKHSSSYEGIDFYEPEYDCELLGIAHELTEEVWDTLVESPIDISGGISVYHDYTETILCCVTATESGLSLLRANEVYAVNPYPDPELTMKQGDGFTYYGASDEEFDQYDKAQQNTGKWIMLKKV